MLLKVYGYEMNEKRLLVSNELCLEVQRQFRLPIYFVCPAVLFPFTLVAYGDMFLWMSLKLWTDNIWIRMIEFFGK